MTKKNQITSMTGFGGGAAEGQGVRLGVELRSVNSRYLDIQVRCPSNLQLFEQLIRERIQAQLSRGKVSVNFSWTEEAQQKALPSLDEEIASGYLTQLQRLAELSQSDTQVDLALLARLPGVFTFAAAEPENDEAKELMLAALDEALVEMISMRTKEGQALAEDLRRRVEAVEAHLEHIAELVPSTREQIQNRLREKVAALLEPGAIHEDRLAMEVALIAERSDITEEVVRFRSHNAQFFAALDKGGEVGKRFNFLLQEMNREANTISSKSSDSDIIHRVVEIKEEVERLREQVQNLA
ncbi:MAG TPA: YicC family protein [Candidatus Latescibacteria bacterium]|nr:YicC family protein [Candidatus Handelsmanbacteria bacterium]HIL09395.1 YicC family protein [Candidatus Latescibacterota bacterium]